MPLVAFAAQVNTSAAQIYPPAGGVTPGVRRITITNNGPNAIEIGPAGVTTATGFRIAAGGTFSLTDRVLNGPIFAIAETALQVSPADTRILIEVGD